MYIFQLRISGTYDRASQQQFQQNHERGLWFQKSQILWA